jgi:hypothetical protein
MRHPYQIVKIVSLKIAVIKAKERVIPWQELNVMTAESPSQTVQAVLFRLKIAVIKIQDHVHKQQRLSAMTEQAL